MVVQNKYRCYNYFNLIVFCLVLIGFGSKAGAQNDSIADEHQLNKKYIVSYWHDTKKIVADPFHWRGKQWSVFAGVLGVSVVAYVYDKEIYDFFQRNRTETGESISKYAIEPWGSGLYSIPLLAGIYIIGNKNDHHRNVALTGLKAYLLSGGAALVAKHIFHRHRPADDDPPNPYLWEGPFEFTTDYTSFPSGHTTTAFAIATVLAQGYRDKMWVGLTSYTVATLVGLSRIYDGKHWATDAIAGAAFGTFIGTVLSRINFTEDSKLTLNPMPVRDGYGLGITYRLD